MNRVLVVNDDPTVSEVVTGYLSRAGFAVDVAADGPAAVARATAQPPDLVVLDLMLPGMDGPEVCRRIRRDGQLPVITLTARGDEEDRVLGLEVGADNYVTKPFSPRELVLRVESVLRRAGAVAARRTAPAEAWLPAEPLALDPAARHAIRYGAELALTAREFDLQFGDLPTVTVHVRRLRGKIEDDPARPRLINTVWGVGYRFDAPGTKGADDAE